LEQVQFALDLDNAPLAWNVGRADARRVSEAWHRDDIKKKTTIVEQFLHQ
jgi:hypothetical protein